jgi:hypothetical protein
MTAGRRTYFRRLIGAVALDAATFEEVEADPGATPQAVLTVVLASLAVGVGVGGLDRGSGLVLLCGVALAAWAAWALLTFEVGVRLLPVGATRADVGELLRTTGFATTPALFFVCALLPGARGPVLVLTALWLLLAMVVAVRQALDYAGTTRAVAVCVVGWALAIALVFGAGFFLGPAVADDAGGIVQAHIGVAR